MARIPSNPIITTVGILVVVLVLAGGVMTCANTSYRAAEAKAAQEERDKAAKTAAYAASLQKKYETEKKAVKVGQERTLYRFGADGCTEEVTLKSDASFYPKGGAVRIYPPSPAKPWDDAPGILTKNENTLLPPGHYRVCKKAKSDAWGVEIWN